MCVWTHIQTPVQVDTQLRHVRSQLHTLAIDQDCEKSPLCWQVENGTYSQVESFFTGIRNPEDQRHLSPTEYVMMIRDSLKMHKNICLCRHFHLLDKRQITSSSASSFIDVWPVNLFQPQMASFFDNTSLFMLQVGVCVCVCVCLCLCLCVLERERERERI